MPYADPITRRRTNRIYDARYKTTRRAARAAQRAAGAPQRSVGQRTSQRHKAAWIRSHAAWECMWPGSALLADLALRARDAGLFHHGMAQRQIEAALRRHIDGMLLGDVLND